MSVKEGIDKISDAAQKVLGDTVTMIEKTTGKKSGTKILHDVGESAIKITNGTFHKLVDITEGSVDVAKGVLSDNQKIRNKGFTRVTGTIEDTANTICSGVKETFKAGAETLDGFYEAAQSAKLGINCQNGIEKAKNGATKIAKALVIGGIAVGAADMAGIIGDDAGGREDNLSKAEDPSLNVISNDSEAADNQYVIADNDYNGSALYEGDGGLFPNINTEEIYGVENGVASEDSLSYLIDMGCIDGTTHIEDPVRSEVAVRDFLDKYGYGETPAGYEVHHIIPLSEGGADHPDNMVLVDEEMHDKITSAHRAFYNW